jgi:hypothetical protein
MLSVLVCLVLQSAQAPPIGVRAELVARNLPAPKDADDLDKPITGYSVLDDRQGFVIAYYALYARDDDRLHDLRVRSFDKRSRTWRSTTVPESIGSVLRIMRGRGYLFISGHSSPSAAPTLVLSATLRKKHELEGWPMLVLDDGRLVFHRSMIHFSPAHAAALALYDPVSDRELPIYPPRGVRNYRGGERVAGTELWMDRSVTDVTKGKAPGTIEFGAVEQRRRLTPDNRSQPAGPERRLRVVCDVAASPARCEARAAVGDARGAISEVR